MVQNVASRAVSRSHGKPQRFVTWSGVVCAAILAGLEGYGSAMAGLGPLGSAVNKAEACFEDCDVPKASDVLICSHPVAEVRSCKSGATAWGYAGEF